MYTLFENNCGLPSNGMILILSFVDCVKIIRMRSVFRNWYKSISNRYFLDFHYRFGPPSRQMYLVQTLDQFPNPTSRRLIRTKKGNMSEEVYDLIPHPTINYIHEHMLVGAINGILCLTYFDNHSTCVFVMANPIIGQILETISPATIAPDGIFFTYKP